MKKSIIEISEGWTHANNSSCVADKGKVISILTAHEVWHDDDFLDIDFPLWLDGSMKTPAYSKPYNRHEYSEEENNLLKAYNTIIILSNQ